MWLVAMGSTGCHVPAVTSEFTGSVFHSSSKTSGPPVAIRQFPFRVAAGCFIKMVMTNCSNRSVMGPIVVQTVLVSY